MPFPRPKKVYTEAELYEYAVGALGRRMAEAGGDKPEALDAALNDVYTVVESMA